MSRLDLHAGEEMLESMSANDDMDSLNGLYCIEPKGHGGPA